MLWRRGVSVPRRVDSPSQRHNPQKSAISAQREPSHSGSGVTDCAALEARKPATCDGVTVRQPLAAKLYAGAQRGAASVAAGPADDIEAAEGEAIRELAEVVAPDRRSSIAS
jgi:hypothetical protein